MTESPAKYRSAPAPVLVCPHCKREVDLVVGAIEGKAVDVYRCVDHGYVPPMKSAVANRMDRLSVDWSAA